jgi:hypothetical protein
MVNYNLLKYSAIIGMIPGVGKYAEEMTMRFINAQMFMQMVDQYMVASGKATADELNTAKDISKKSYIPISDKLANLCDNFKNFFAGKSKSHVSPYGAMRPDKQIDWAMKNDKGLIKILDKVTDTKSVTDVMTDDFREKYISDNIDYSALTDDVLKGALSNLGDVDPRISDRIHTFFDDVYEGEKDLKTLVAELNLDLNVLTEGKRFDDKYLGNYRIFEVVDELSTNSYLSTLSNDDIVSLVDKIDNLPYDVTDEEVFYLLGSESKSHLREFETSLMYPHLMDSASGRVVFFTNSDGKIYTLNAADSFDAMLDISKGKTVFKGSDKFFEAKVNPMAMIAMNGIIKEDGLKNEKFSGHVKDRVQSRLMANTDADKVTVQMIRTVPFKPNHLEDEYFDALHDKKFTFGGLIDAITSSISKVAGKVFDKCADVVFNAKYGSIDYDKADALNTDKEISDDRNIDTSVQPVVDNSTVSNKTVDEDSAKDSDLDNEDVSKDSEFEPPVVDDKVSVDNSGTQIIHASDLGISLDDVPDAYDGGFGDNDLGDDYGF